MKKIINGKLYDTDTANLIGCRTNSYIGDLYWLHECLYRKATGEYFLFGEGGPMSCYNKSVGVGSTSGDKKIIPITKKEAMVWAEEYLDADQYISYFGDIAE